MKQIAYSIAEVATLIGMQPATVRKWAREGTIKASKIGKHYFIMKDELLNLLS